MIEAHPARHRGDYAAVLVLLAGVLFDAGLIRGWVALLGAGVLVTVDKVITRPATVQRDDRTSLTGSA